MNTKALSFLCAPALVAMVGCSSDVTFTSGVDKTKKVSEVTPDEAQTLCENAAATAQDFAESVKDDLCVFVGAITGAFAGGLGGGDPVVLCEAAVADCKSQELEPVDTTDCNAEAQIANCDATIEEIEACYNDSLEATTTALAAIGSQSCSDLLTGAEPNISVDVSAPASCTALQQKCPGLEVGIPAIGTSAT